MIIIFFSISMQTSFKTCPVEAYFPLPLVDKMEEKFQTGSSAYRYCKSKLQSLVTELRLRKDRNRFHFYFGDSLELCLTNEDLKNKMRVIHCSEDFVKVGLPNLLPAASGCLTSKIPESVLLTEMDSYRHDDYINWSESVEYKLYCPLTMVPTVYGMRLFDHIRLGNSVCCELHDHFKMAVPTTFKWYKAQIGFSANIRMETSLSLKNVVCALVRTCFMDVTKSAYSSQELNPIRKLIFQNLPSIRNSPLTFYYIVQPLLSHNWREGAIESLIEECFSLISIPPGGPYKIGWTENRCCSFTITAVKYEMPFLMREFHSFILQTFGSC